MAHSPLLRTLARLRLDSKSIALVNYELALEGISANLQQPPNKENFDENRWTDLRKAYESKKIRESQQKEYENYFIARLTKERRLRLNKDKARQSVGILRAWEELVPMKSQAIRLTVQKSGFAEWKPPLVSECLLYEQSPAPNSPCGRVHMGETGILDRRLLHHAISPKYVPKPHFKMERKRLAAKSAEFAAFVELQTSGGPNKRSLIPRPEDESSDEGLLSVNEPQVSEEDDNGLPSSKRLGLGIRKRKRTVKRKPKKRTRKPPRFTKLYDCKVHDRAHLDTQATNWFSLMQQRLPRVESPSVELVSKPRSKESPVDVDVNEDPTAQELRIHGIKLPVRFPHEDAEGEQQSPTPEEAAQYRDWRNWSRPFFNERDRYMQSRVYREKARDRDLLHATQALLGFWAGMNV
ncbi:hypothetical protein F5Y06DRAFT_292749 [Hypoxylon sp. FL0890]|nr:hypothetical protein F5Y06DRAFT_292749 [Hypoxylon sp. FL0890]